MKIAVNTRLLLKGKLEGIGWFIHETMSRIVRSHPEYEFFFLFDRPFDTSFIYANNVKPVILKPPARHPILWYLWFEKAVPKFLKKNNIDLFISPDGYSSVATKTKKISVIHDINYHHFPENLPFLVRRFLNYYTQKYAETADRICTVSDFSKEDISHCYHIDENKIDVLHNGANALYQPIDSKTKKQIKKDFTEGQDFFVFIGALNKRKNIARLLEAYDLFRISCDCETKMVIIGEKMFNTPDIEKVYSTMKYQKDVVFLGRLEPEPLKNVLGSALALTFVSTYEGFGIPILEAMKCDTPVLTSSVTAMPEIAGDAALLCDPYDVDDIKDKLVELNRDTDLRKSLIEKGRLRSKQFCWDKTAENFWASILKGLN